MTLAANPVLAEDPVAADVVSNASQVVTGEPTVAATGESASELAIFGIGFLGIIGLLWIRRHTSEP